MRILALIGGTWREALRRHIYVVFPVFFIVAFLLVTYTPATDPLSKEKMALSWMSRCTSLLGFFLLILFVAQSLPDFFERRWHVLVFTKPLSPLEFVLGKFLGYALVLLILLLGMGGLSCLLLYEQCGTGFFHHFQGWKNRPFDRFEFLNGTGKTQEKIGTQTYPWVITLKGEADSAMRWTWYNLPPTREPAIFSFIPEVAEDRQNKGSALVTIFNGFTQQEIQKTIPCYSLRIQKIALPPSMVEPGGTLQITLRREKTWSQMAMSPTLASLQIGYWSFLFNFFSYLLTEYGKMVLILAGLMALASLASTPTVILFGLFLVLWGMAISSTLKNSQWIAGVLEQVELKQAHHQATPETHYIPVGLARYALTVVGIGRTLLPSFKPYERFPELLEGRAISFVGVLSLLLQSVEYSLFWLCLAWLGIRRAASQAG